MMEGSETRVTGNLKMDFGWGESYYVSFIPFDKIEADAPALPGLYVWNIHANEMHFESVFQLVQDLFQQRTLDAKVTGDLRLRYEGSLTKQEPGLSEVDVELFRNLLVCVPYPLYIGISRQINKRLRDHKGCLEKVVFSKIDEIAESKNDPDSENESLDFGQRVGACFKKKNIFQLDALYVRYFVPDNCVVCDDPCTRGCREATFERLRNVESAANSLFNPVFGRR